VRERHGLAETDVVGLFVAHNFRLKGLPALLHAMALRARTSPGRRPVHLLVCGGGKIAPMRKLVDRLGLADVVRLVGFADDVRDYYHAADFFVLPSYYDPCSLVVFEALACGLPVITTAQNGAGEVLSEGLDGFVISRPDDHAATARALDRMTDDAARRAMSRRAVELGRPSRSTGTSRRCWALPRGGGGAGTRPDGPQGTQGNPEFGGDAFNSLRPVFSRALRGRFFPGGGGCRRSSWRAARARGSGRSRTSSQAADAAGGGQPYADPRGRPAPARAVRLRRRDDHHRVLDRIYRDRFAATASASARGSAIVARSRRWARPAASRCWTARASRSGLNGDILTTLDFGAMYAFHRQTKAAATIAAFPRKVRIDFGVLDFASASAPHVLTGYREKPELSYEVSMGLYILDPRRLGLSPPRRAPADARPPRSMRGEGRPSTPSARSANGSTRRHDDYALANEIFQARARPSWAKSGPA
jgi:hypothetical protein